MLRVSHVVALRTLMGGEEETKLGPFRRGAFRLPARSFMGILCFSPQASSGQAGRASQDKHGCPVPMS